MTQLSSRQQKIAEFIIEKGQASNRDIVAFFAEKKEIISRETVARDLKDLLAKNILRKVGKGRSLAYIAYPSHPLLFPIDSQVYFSKSPDERSKEKIQFDFEIIEKLGDIFNQTEIAELNSKNEEYRKKLNALSPTIIQKELERVTIELSWKSSKIEGNTYSLIDTEILIKENKEAEGHKREEAVMILNHKKALDYILGSKDKFKKLSAREVENVHRLLVDELNVNMGIRSRAVGITGTNYAPLDNYHQIKEALDKSVEKINSFADPWTKSLASLIMLSYIQPFEDGNKRTSRLIANALLISHSICPLSFRSIDEAEYKKAVILIYELRNAELMKKLFLEQFDFSITHYFL